MMWNALISPRPQPEATRCLRKGWHQVPGRRVSQPRRRSRARHRASRTRRSRGLPGCCERGKPGTYGRCRICDKEGHWGDECPDNTVDKQRNHGGDRGRGRDRSHGGRDRGRGGGGRGRGQGGSSGQAARWSPSNCKLYRNTGHRTQDCALRRAHNQAQPGTAMKAHEGNSAHPVVVEHEVHVASVAG